MSGWKKKLATLVLFHLAIALFLLLYDERPRPEIQSFLLGTTDSIDDRENAFFAFAGFDAAQGKDIDATGKIIADKLAGEIKKNPLLDKFDRDPFLGQKSVLKGEDLLKSGGARFTYFPDVVRRKPDIEKLLAEN